MVSRRVGEKRASDRAATGTRRSFDEEDRSPSAGIWRRKIRRICVALWRSNFQPRRTRLRTAKRAMCVL